MSTSPAVPSPVKVPVRDCFKLLGQPRQPWIDPEELKSAFHRLSAELHPDRVHDRPESERRAAGDHYAELNGAYQVLRDPKERLAHLLELELGARPTNVQQVSGPAASRFFAVGELCRSVDAFLDSRKQLNSPLLKARSFTEALDWTDRLQSLQSQLVKARQDLEEELAQMNRTWATAVPGAAESTLKRLETIYRELGFITRWLAELNERVVRLAG